MNSMIRDVLIFATGALIGSLVTWRLTKAKYEQTWEDEYEDDVENRETYDSEEDVHENRKESYKSYRNIVANNNYSDIEEKEDDKTMNDNLPYVISPDEFGENEDYDTVTLTYYTDGVLTDDRDNVIDDVDDLIGYESLNHFGEYEDDPDVVYVRNDDLKTDFEILLDMNKYSDIQGY